MKRKILALLLSVALVLSTLPGSVFAVGGPTLTVGAATVDAGGTGSVTVSVSGNTGFDTVSFQIPTVSGLTVTSVSTTGGIISTWTSDYNSNNGKFSAFSGSSVAENGEICTINFTVDSSANGNIQLTLEEDNNADGIMMLDDAVVEGVTFQTGTITVNAPAGDGYTATIENGTQLATVRVGNEINVKVGANKAFNATEMTITYDKTLVSFDGTQIPAGCTIKDDGNGTLVLAAYGDSKADTYKYVLTFTANAAGNAVFGITEAGFGTEENAVKEDLTGATLPGNLTVEIRPELVDITFTDEFFHSETTQIEKGSSFTFRPEQATGGYYNYTLPTATVGGQSATVKDNGNGTWTIENVTGDVTINAAVRTPKSFGNVTYSGTGAGDVTNQTTTATYLTDITFTIPADKAAGIADGYEYTVTATIGGSNYSLSDLSTDASGNRTYTIPGADVKGAVVVTVTKTTLAANKVTVSIGGNGASDGKYDGAEDAGASIQVDKNNGSATLVVDTTTGLNKGYNYEIKNGDETLTKGDDGNYHINNITSDTTITINKTLNVDGVKNTVNQGGDEKDYLTLSGTKMWLIQLPNNVQNTTDAVYTYNGQNMFWSADHNNYVIVVVSATAPEITADQFALTTVSATPTITSSYWDVNKSGTLDALDAQLIWNMYNTRYDSFTEDVTAEKFILADANHDGILDTKDAIVIINQILGISG